jgi:hypothetical protein
MQIGNSSTYSRDYLLVQNNMRPRVDNQSSLRQGKTRSGVSSSSGGITDYPITGAASGWNSSESMKQRVRGGEFEKVCEQYLEPLSAKQEAGLQDALALRCATHLLNTDFDAACESNQAFVGPGHGGHLHDEDQDISLAQGLGVLLPAIKSFIQRSLTKSTHPAIPKGGFVQSTPDKHSSMKVHLTGLKVAPLVVGDERTFGGMDWFQRCGT